VEFITMKYRIFWMRSCVAGLLASASGFPGLSMALTLEQAIELAEREAPSLVAQAANQQAARSAAIPAGALPDPKLRLGVQNLPIEGESRGELGAEAMTMQAIGVTQEVPSRAKRRARIDAANAEVALADTQQNLTLLQVRQQTAEAWIAALAVERKLALFAQLYQENDLFAKAIKARFTGGKGQSADILLPRQEAITLADREDLLHRDKAGARAELRRWIGDAAYQSLEGDWPEWPQNADEYRQNLVQHPELQIFKPLSRQAEAEVAEAVADKTPDWGWGLAYQRRGREFGDMVSLSVTMDLPVFAGSRQNPRIAAERARMAKVQSDRDSALRLLESELVNDLAEYQRLSKGLARVEQDLLPLAEERVQLTMADYRAGGGELVAVIRARQELVETRLRRIDLVRNRALIYARLHFAFGGFQP
tara:strand:- start:36124 stop:37392 length:1269 start_codon:yes stop_codon:yes gene_type:complete